MRAAADEARIGRAIEAIYDAAVTPGRWPVVLAQLAELFGSHFADVFARTHDRTAFRGLAHGLDERDYQDEFLGVWVKRNVWGTKRPVETAGEVLSTRMMVPVAELMRSEMYNDYLAPRDLHEGLRLAIWSGEGWIQDVSLLRSWSAGPFEAEELALARQLVPHLSRAALVARRLREAASTAAAGFAALDAVGTAAFLLMADGRVLQWNTAAERLLAEADGLTLQAARLVAARCEITRQIDAAIAPGTRGARVGATLSLPRPSGRCPLTLVTVPLSIEQDWQLLRPPAILAVVQGLPANQAPAAARLAATFDLTGVETEVALALLAGHDAAEIARNRGRSVHTIRTHLARLMGKTHTNRQSELMRKLMHEVPAPHHIVSPGPMFG